MASHYRPIPWRRRFPFAILGALAGAGIVLGPVAAPARDLVAFGEPTLHRALGEPTLAPLNPREGTRKLGSAVVALIALASRTHNLVIAIDDVHRADDASLGVLARLGTLTQPHRLLLVTTCDEAALASAPAVLEQIVAPADRIALGPIDKDHTRELLGSVFGDVSGLRQQSTPGRKRCMGERYGRQATFFRPPKS